MSEKKEKGFNFEKLVLMSFDGSISKEDFLQLDNLLGRDSEARQRYFDLLKLNQSLCSYENIVSFVPDSIAGDDGLEMSGDLGLEDIACPGSGDFDGCLRNRNPRSNYVQDFLKIAAVLIVCVSAVWIVNALTRWKSEPFQKLVSVATLDVVREASWDDKGDVLQAGDRLYVNQEIKFLTGTARIRFDNNADVLVQGPVSLRIKGTDLLYLEEGKLTAFIPPSAKGFTVLTPVAEVVDYGTEFGVTVDKSGKTETSVFKGEVDLRAAADEGKYQQIRITAGLSRSVDQDMNLTGEVAVDETVYKRLGFNVNINFQPAEAEVPKGYTFDDGSLFADRGNGYTYGWDHDISGKLSDKPEAGASRHRKDRIEYDDRRYDTLVHMQKIGKRRTNNEKTVWEIEVPNGIYRVDLVMGDPQYTDAINNVLIEGVVLDDPDGEDNFDRYSDVTVIVTDGRLTVKPAIDADNAKLCFIKISQK